MNQFFFVAVFFEELFLIGHKLKFKVRVEGCSLYINIYMILHTSCAYNLFTFNKNGSIMKKEVLFDKNI